MDRAYKVMRGMSLLSPEELARAAWPQAVGKKIAAHTRPARMVRTRLIVEVEDDGWKRQLFGLTQFILRNLAKELGEGLVEEVEFRIVPRRREPERAQQAMPGTLFDEADAIEDPVLRSIYRTSRKKAQA
jgi:predicted nucleic acid-binding Zn ribbon protein